MSDEGDSVPRGSRGYIRLWRKILDSEALAGSPERLTLFVHMLLLAAYKPTSRIVNGVTVKLDRGELCASVRYLSQKSGLSVRQVRTGQTILANFGVIELKKGNPGGKQPSVIKISKYGDYQSSNGEERQTKRQTKRQTNDKPAAQVKEEEEGIRRKEDSRAAPGLVFSTRDFQIDGPLYGKLKKEFPNVRDMDRALQDCQNHVTEDCIQVGNPVAYLRRYLATYRPRRNFHL